MGPRPWHALAPCIGPGGRRTPFAPRLAHRAASPPLRRGLLDGHSSGTASRSCRATSASKLKQRVPTAPQRLAASSRPAETADASLVPPRAAPDGLAARRRDRRSRRSWRRRPIRGRGGGVEGAIHVEVLDAQGDVGEAEGAADDSASASGMGGDFRGVVAVAEGAASGARLGFSQASARVARSARAGRRRDVGGMGRRGGSSVRLAPVGAGRWVPRPHGHRPESPSSSPAQDSALSRLLRGFESRWRRKFTILARRG
jgi:hypothetical protein